MSDPKPKAATVPRKQSNIYLSRALAQWQVGHSDKADTAARKLVDTLRAAGILSEGKA